MFWGRGIIGYRFNANGDQIDASPIAIGNGFLPSVATNGTDFFVAWNAGSDGGNANAPNPPDLLDVYGARVTAAGAVDAKPLPGSQQTHNKSPLSSRSPGLGYSARQECWRGAGGEAAQIPTNQ